MLGLLFRFGAWLLGGLVAMVPTLVGQILISLGIGVATYTGVDVALSWLKTGAVSAMLGLPPQVVGMLALMKVGSCVSMVFSAIVIRAGLTGMQSGTIRNWVKR